MKRTLFTASILTLMIGSIGVSIASDAEDLRDARLRAAEAWMDFQMRDQFAPGASVALTLDQDVIWSHAYGYSDVSAKQAMTPNHSYSICSISKLFTSIGVMTLVDDGKV